jgi:ABC-type lipoprotein release transport system permease subunit
MTRYVLRQLRWRPARAATLALGIAVAAVAFVLLTSAAASSELRIRSTLNAHFRSAYDILVRPRGSRTALEQERELVQPNFMSGIFGGITLAQWHRILTTPGVQVAAPVENVGYLLMPVTVTLRIGRFVSPERDQLFRLRLAWLEDGSRYPGNTLYVYVTRRRNGCDNLDLQAPELDFTSPFAVAGPANVSFRCYEPDAVETPLVGSWSPSARGGIAISDQVEFSLLLAAVAPRQEQELLDIDRTRVSGLGLADLGGYSTSDLGPIVPVIASTHAYTDVRLRASVEQVRIPPATSARALLYDPPPRPTAVQQAEREQTRSYARVTRLESQPVGSIRLGAQTLYNEALAQLGGFTGGSAAADAYWTVSPIRYRRDGAALAVQPVTRDPNHEFAGGTQEYGYTLVPPGNGDVQFRIATSHLYRRNAVNAGFLSLQIAGRFDPGRLPSFDPLVRVPLASYLPPLAEPADPSSRQALHGLPLAPTTNLGDYLTQPPLLLTTLQAARALTSTRFFQDAAQSEAAVEATLHGRPPPPPRGPISVIRVRVAGVTGADRLSLARVRAVASRIERETDLAVDVTAGSSPTSVTVHLPAGRFGRPALTLRESWSKKGATLVILDAVDRKSLVLFSLVLLVTGLFLANSVLASVRSRRREIGMLLCIGWSQAAVLRVLLAEVAFVAGTSGLAATGLAIGLVQLLGLDLPLLRTLAVLPLSLSLALLAGLVPSWRAARGSPLAAIQPRPLAVGRHRRTRRLSTYALANLARLPARTFLAALALAIGVAGLTVLAGVERSFHGTVVGTVLGNVVSFQVRDSDLASLGLTIGLAALAVGDVLYVSLGERAPELVTLQTLGWRDRHLHALVELEGLGLALLGSGAGAAAGLVSALLLGLPAATAGLAALGAAAAGTGAVLAVALLPLSQVRRLTGPAVLAAE